MCQLYKTNRVVIERVAMVKRHTKLSQKNPQGGIIEKEGSIHLSNVMPLDPGSDKADARVKVKLEDGTRRRIGKVGNRHRGCEVIRDPRPIVMTQSIVITSARKRN